MWCRSHWLSFLVVLTHPKAAAVCDKPKKLRRLRFFGQRDKLKADRSKEA